VNPKPVLPGSRVIWLKLDPSAKTATLIRSLARRLLGEVIAGKEQAAVGLRGRRRRQLRPSEQWSFF
jgi:hypothetical protein